jgi:alpha-amylase
MRLRTYRFFDIGAYHNYYDDYQNQFILRRVADKCYLPMNQLLYDLIQEYGSAFKVSFSISGVAIDQFEMYAPDVLESFKRLADTGSVEFIAETHSHSLCALKSKEEFKNQIKDQSAKVEKHFGQKPVTFRNTELIYSDEIGQKPVTFRNTELIYSDEIGAMVADLGYETMLTEGAKHVLGWKSPNYLYCNAQNPKLKLLLKNFQLSDDIAFRFSERGWGDWPLTTEKYVDWLNAVDPKQEVINLFMDYETFGEHQWPETGIFDFMRALPARVFSHSNYTFNTPSELSKELQPVSAIHVPYPISWADEERDLTAWLGNDLQDDAFDNLYNLEDLVRKIDDPEIHKDWRYLQTSDHFYYMCTKWFSDGDVHKYFNPYGTPYDAYINYMNVLSDFRQRVETISGKKIGEKVKEIAEDIGDELKKQSEKLGDEVKKAKKKARESWEESQIKDMTIDDIAKLSNQKIKELVKKVNIDELAGALKDASDEVRDKVIPNLTKTAKEKMEVLDKEMKLKKEDLKKYTDKVEKELSNLFKKKK